MKPNTMKRFLSSLTAAVILLVLPATLRAQPAPSDADAQLKNALQMIERLASQMAAQDARIAAQDVRIKDLEAAHGGSPPAAAASAASIAQAAPTPPMPEPAPPIPEPAAQAA